MTPLETAIIKTVFYFDQCGFAPTILEIEKWLLKEKDLQKFSLDDLLTTISRSSLFTYHHGMVARVGKETLIQKRIESYTYSEEKWKHVHRYIRLMSMMPGVEAIFLCNGMGWGNVRKKSDIDLCIVTSEQRLWSARFYTTLAMKLLRQRPGEIDQSKAICLSFYVTKSALNLQQYQFHENDIPFAFWVAQMYPVYDPKNIFITYQKENRWLEKIFFHLSWITPHPQRRIHISWIEKKFQQIVTALSPEQFLQKWQQKKFPKEIIQQEKEKKGVVISDDVLKLHTHDNRLERLKKWETELTRYKK